jgi:hypothetical protein
MTLDPNAMWLLIIGMILVAVVTVLCVWLLMRRK